jgi:molybdopterin molybdotransferase
MKEFFQNAKSFDEALALAQSLVEPINEIVTITTTEAPGRMLAEEIVSPLNLPGFIRSGMDGFAVCAQDTQPASPEHPIKLKILGRAEMGQDPASLPTLRQSQAMEIGTGGPLPPGSDSVVLLEETERLASEQVHVFARVQPGENTIAPDEDFKIGEKIFSPGHRVRPADIGALLALGYAHLKVFRRVRVGVISTGDELVPAHQTPKPGQIREINTHILRAQLTEMGADAHVLGIVPDDRTALLEAVQRALKETDFVLLSGGSSVGTKDLTESVLQALGEIFVHGLRMKPGKPTIFAMSKKTPMVGLPGNPVSSAVVFATFVAPLVLRRAGALPNLLCRWRRVKTNREIKSIKGRTDFVPLMLKQDGSVEPVKGHTTHISTLAKSSGFLFIEADSEGVPEQKEVWFEVW